MLAEFQRMAPFGPGNPEPRFALADVRSDYPTLLRGGHVRCNLIDAAGGRLKAIAWRAEDTDLGRRLLAGGGALHVVGQLRPDDWNGRAGVQLEIEDVADPRRVGAR
jgi:single-stranded-DNA-specific exonuclease